MKSTTLDRLAKQYLGAHKAEKKTEKKAEKKAARVVAPAKTVSRNRQVAAPRAATRFDPHDMTNRPLAAQGLTSYRYRGRFGWVMIGARDTKDALLQAQRSVSEKVEIGKLQIWEGDQYVPARAVSTKRKRPEEDPIYLACLRRDKAYLQQQERQKKYDLDLAELDRKEAERRHNWENQPGFYIVPGEGGNEDPDGNDYATTGPYGLFEKAGHTKKSPNYESFEDSGFDVEDDAGKIMATTPNGHVTIVYAKNPREAVAGGAHVWWQDGIFFGPPVDPRQHRWNF